MNPSQTQGGYRELLGRLPVDFDLEATARESGAFARSRAVRDAAGLLRLALLYGACGLSLRAVAAIAELEEIASVVVKLRVPNADAELAVGFFGSRYERATPAEREYMRAMAVLGDDPVQTAQVAEELGRKPSSVSPARDSLIKKGLIYSSERGLIAFTVPHFGRFLRAQPT